MSDKDPDLEIYPNSPLTDVVCEIRFPGELEVECNRHVFWDKIREHYPHILVPQAELGKPLALTHYRFRDEAGNRHVSVALNSLAFSESKYSGHVNYIQEFARVADIFHKCFPKIDRVSRIGWRYINVIPYAREAGLVPVGQFLNARVLLAEETLKAPKVFDIRVESAIDEGTVIVRLATITRKDGTPSKDNAASQEAILLDIDFGFENSELRFKDYKKCIDQARRHNRSLFERLVTDDYRKYLRGETL
jgi:uncharacterized protein (TIGR04255 family)